MEEMMFGAGRASPHLELGARDLWGTEVRSSGWAPWDIERSAKQWFTCHFGLSQMTANSPRCSALASSKKQLNSTGFSRLRVRLMQHFFFQKSIPGLNLLLIPFHHTWKPYFREICRKNLVLAYYLSVIITLAFFLIFFRQVTSLVII